MDCPNKEAQFEMTIFSNHDVELERLDDQKNSALIGKWEQDTAGGCHLYVPEFYKEPELKNWAYNPTYILAFEKAEPSATVTITLAIAEKNWKGKLANKYKNQEDPANSK